MQRFVILRHDLPAHRDRPSHWDLMLQQGNTLRTWALDDEPVAGSATSAERLADHRLEYLQYEGPLSGDRGSVSRWDEGEYQITAENDNQLKLELCGQRWQGVVEMQLQSDEPQRWTVVFSAE